MGLADSLANARDLLNRLREHGEAHGDGTLTTALADLDHELTAIEAYSRELGAENQRLKGTASAPANTPVKERGCYRVPGDEAFYCISCWDSEGRRTPTRRLSARRRVCPVCKVSIST